MMKSIVNLSDYNPCWEKQFEYENKRILNVFGDQAIGIEHIGSTSIKGLKAKPIIDIIVAVLIQIIEQENKQEAGVFET